MVPNLQGRDPAILRRIGDSGYKKTRVSPGKLRGVDVRVPSDVNSARLDGPD
jgi:hypothetical protein